MIKYGTWSLPFDTWLLCDFGLHIGYAATVAHPICAKRPQSYHVSKVSGHALSITYLRCKVAVNITLNKQMRLELFIELPQHFNSNGINVLSLYHRGPMCLL